MAREAAIVTDTLAHIAAVVAEKLATSRISGTSAYITTPLTYLGGSPVVVRLDQQGIKYFVSDAGLGSREAELVGGIRAFPKIADTAAARFGVAFDRHAFFEAEVSTDDLISSVIAVANASRSAADLVSYRMAEKAANDARFVMRERLFRAFNPSIIATDFVFRGASNDEWEFDAAVKQDEHLALFQVVTPAPQSVVSAAARFIDVSDISQAEPPRLVGVLQDRARTQRIKLLQRSAMIIDMAAETPVWQRAAA